MLSNNPKTWSVQRNQLTQAVVSISAAVSSSGKITADASAAVGNRLSFAVTYDSPQSSNRVKFFFGSNGNAAVLDVARSYARGLTGTNISHLCIRQFDLASRGYGTDRMFRGLIDEVQIFGQALSQGQIQTVQTGVPAPSPELRMDVLNPQLLLLSWIGSGLSLQVAPNVTGPWTANTDQTGAQFIQPVGVSQCFRLQQY